MSKSIISVLRKINSFFFFTGFITGKLQYLPIPVVASVCTIFSLFFYLIGYCVWVITSYFHPNHIKEEYEWYGFAQFKEQHLLAAFFGLLAVSLSLAAIFVPVLAIPAAWIFCASNLMWCIGEYHKFNNPHSLDENYSHAHQKTYLAYAVTLTTTNAVTALTVTLIFFFPAAMIPIFIVSGLTLMGLGVLIAETWLNHTFGHYKSTPASVLPTNSHFQMSQTLGPKLQCEEAPYQGSSLLGPPSNTKPPARTSKEIEYNQLVDKGSSKLTEKVLLASEQIIHSEHPTTCSMTY